MNISGDTRLLRSIENLSVHDHLCLIYENQKEQFNAVIPFIRIGLAKGEKCIYIADDNTAEEVINAMRADGINVGSALGKGALVIASKKETYLKKGYFDPDDMIQFLKVTTDSAIKEGFHALRATGEMTWVLGKDPGSMRLIEYESKLNLFFPGNDCLAICQYNKNRFSPEIIKDIINTHPLVIIGGFVCRNFYYIPPEEFLKKEKGSLEVERLLSNLIDREKTEYALRRSERELNESQRVTQVGSWQWIVASDTITWSPGYYGIIGRDLALPPPNYMEHLKMYTQESAARLEAAVAETLKNGTPYELDMELLHPDGSRRFMIARGEAVRDAAGQVEMLRGTLQDITERKKVEQALRESEEIFRRFMEYSPIYVFFKDENIRALRLSKNYETMLGKPLKELLGKSMDDLFPSGLAKMMVADDQRILKEGKEITVEEELNGRFYSTTKFPIFIDGKPRYLAGFSTDITQRKQTEEELRKYREHLEELVKERTVELKNKNEELEKFNRLFVGRELRMIELKKKIAELESSSGKVE